MKIDKHGEKYRVRKMIKGKTYSFYFDHEPSQKEIDLAFLSCTPTSSINAPSGDFNFFAHKYLTVKDNVLSVSTKRGYMIFINTLPSWFMELPIKDIKREDVQKLVNDYSVNHSPKSCRNMHGFISAVLSMFNPDLILNTTLPQKIEYQGYVPTPEEVAKILDAAKGSKYWICFKLGTYGLRRSEICALSYPNDFDGRSIHISKAMVIGDDLQWHIKATKTTSSTRDVIISQEMLDVIAKQGYVYNGCPDAIRENLMRYQKKVGVQKFRFHDLRAYFATEMSRILPEADWLAMGGWETDYVAKKVYRKSRIKQNADIQLKASDALENLK